MELLVQHLGHGLGLTLLLSLPCVLVAAGVGLVVGILQAVTQVQEQTISAAPKIVAVFLIIILGGGLMMNLMTEYMRETVHIAFNEVPMDGDFILPPRRNQTPGQLRAKEFFKLQSSPGNNKERLKELMATWPGTPGNASDSGPMLIKPPAAREEPLGFAEKMMLKGN